MVTWIHIANVQLSQLGSRVGTEACFGFFKREPQCRQVRAFREVAKPSKKPAKKRQNLPRMAKHWTHLARGAMSRYGLGPDAIAITVAANLHWQIGATRLGLVQPMPAGPDDVLLMDRT